MADVKVDMPANMVNLNKPPRRYDIIDLFIVSGYNFFTFILGLGLGYFLWGAK
tara:strand:- start:561 stop:719 length:159 start_codon:yes stop_codon:yes gene_type:complete